MATTVKVDDVKVLGSWVVLTIVPPRMVSNLVSSAMKIRIVISRKVTGAKVAVLVSAPTRNSLHRETELLSYKILVPHFCSRYWAFRES